MAMNYEEVLSYLYNNLPMFQRMGGMALKKDLENTRRLCAHLNNPENKFRSVHIAGTNGKGSSSHFLASILQEAGYKVGLYTSPHLKSFTERIRINGKQVDPDFVTEFVNQHQVFIESLRPSFFEITVGMAFDYFAREQVDIAVIEVGMGGRLDSTNVIRPEVALITNISYDHQQWLGDTLPEIAGEKAGVIKEGIPVVLGEHQDEILHVFLNRAEELNAPVLKSWENYSVRDDGETLEVTGPQGMLALDASAMPGYQKLNLPGVLAVTDVLRRKGYAIGTGEVQRGILRMKQNTGLMGRWQVIAREPKVICDVGHNVAGMQFVVEQLYREPWENLFMILGMVADKDIAPVLALLPKEAKYYFCEAKIPRALPAEQLGEKASDSGLTGTVVADVNDALTDARLKAGKNDLIFIGGSNFIVAEINELT